VNLEVITPGKTLYQGEIVSINVPGSKGSFTVLKNHAPIISTLDKGELRIITSDKRSESIEIEGGIIEVKKNNIIVLADIA
jgi:F-type H+-transporting ATPase subunit epsilon